MSLDDGGPAFASHVTLVCKHGEDRTDLHRYAGLTLRDWFAGMTMQGVMQLHGAVVGGPEKAASMAYEYADAMLAERAK